MTNLLHWPLVLIPIYGACALGVLALFLVDRRVARAEQDREDVAEQLGRAGHE